MTELFSGDVAPLSDMTDLASNGASPFLNRLVGIEGKERPIWLMRQAGRYLPEYKQVRKQAGSFLDLCFNPELACEVTLQPIRRFDFDAAILFSDILTVPLVLGAGVRFQEGVGPLVETLSPDRPIKTFSSPEETRAAVQQTLGPVFEAVSEIRSALPPNKPLIGFAGAPWTVASYMLEGKSSRDFAKALSTAYAAPEWFASLIERLTDVTIEYLSLQIEAGADCVKLFDSWAGVLPPTLIETASIEPFQRIAKTLKQRYPNKPFIAFPRGVGLRYGEYVKGAKNPINGVAIDTTLPLDFAVKTLGKKVAIQGNLDPLALVQGGDILDREIDRITEGLDGTRHIFNLGHGILPHTPIAHVERLVERVREH